MTQAALFETPKPAPKKPGIDDWLLAQLETKTGGFRAARWGRCRTCQQITLTGMDADLTAGIATVDPTPLSPQQEHACMITGRETYTLTNRGNTYTLDDRRGATRYGPRPPNHHRSTIVPAHQCGARFPGFIQKPTTTKETTNECPF